MTTELTVRPLRTEADYEAALKQYEGYFDKEPELGSPEGDHFELLGLVIAKYEDEHYPIKAAEPVETIKLVMEANNYSKADLGRVLGSRSRATEILNGRRDLTVAHMRALARDWRIPVQMLVGEGTVRR